MFSDIIEPISICLLIRRCMSLKEKAKKAEMKLAAVYVALKRKDTPLLAKIFAGLAIAYALSPIDLIPDFIPVLGYLDDLLIVPALAALAIKFIPIEIMKECESEAEKAWNEGKRKRWYFALPIIFFWAVIIAVIIFAVI